MAVGFVEAGKPLPGALTSLATSLHRATQNPLLTKYCGKEFKRKLEQGPVDHEIDVKCKVYENGRVAADQETLRQLEEFSEREIAEGTGLHRKPIRLLKPGGTVTRRTYQKIATFLREQAGRSDNRQTRI